MKDQDKMSRPDDDSPTRGQGTWIIRPRRRAKKHDDQMRLPLADVRDDVDTTRLSDEEFRELLRGDDDLKKFSDAEFRQVLLGDDDDIEADDLASVEDQKPLTDEESAALDRALEALVQALKEVIGEMYPDEEPAR